MSERVQKWNERWHLSAGLIWIVLFYPAVVYWKDSLLYIIICSQYANIESSFSAWLASRAGRE